jgi:hypothetical protein
VGVGVGVGIEPSQTPVIAPLVDQLSPFMFTPMSPPSVAAPFPGLPDTNVKSPFA